MATARKLPSGSFRVRVYDNDSGKYKSFTAATKREAERMASDWLIEREEEKKREQMLTFSAAAQIYINQRRATLSPTTIHLYEGYLKNATVRLNDMYIEEITTQQVQDWVNEMTVSKSPKTVHNMYGFFTAVIGYHDVDLRLKKITLPKKVRHFKRLPTAELVINAFRGSEIELPVMLAVWCGMRMSEILGIHKEDIDGDVLTINRVIVTVNRKPIVKQRAKTYSSNRQIRLAKPLLELINAVDCADDEPLIKFSGGQIYDRFVRVMEHEGYKICFHDLRHINASVMAELGIPDIYAMERGGWSNTSTLRNVYQQTFDDARNKVDSTIDNYFEKIYDTKYDTNSIKVRKTGT